MGLHAVTYDVGITTRFRGLTSRQGMLLRGPAGWAEWSPFAEYDDAEAAWWLRAAVEAATVGFPAPRRDRIPVNAIVPALSPELAAARVRASGCTTAKVKVAERGQSLSDDVARVAAVRDALGDQGRIRVDANGGWTLDAALFALAELAPFGLEYAEQPCASVPELAALRRRLAEAGITVLVAADESIRRADDPLAVRDADAADVAVIKVQPLGGVRRCLALAAELGMPVVVSSALETSIGLRQGVALAAALPELPYACGLETASLLVDDVSVEPLLAADGHLPVRELVVDEDRLGQVAARADVAGWWRDRLTRVAALVADWPGLEES